MNVCVLQLEPFVHQYLTSGQDQMMDHRTQSHIYQLEGVRSLALQFLLQIFSPLNLSQLEVDHLFASFMHSEVRVV